jgi:hypothetical protein
MVDFTDNAGYIFGLVGHVFPLLFNILIMTFITVSISPGLLTAIKNVMDAKASLLMIAFPDES